jgi:hypothetical protein
MARRMGNGRNGVIGKGMKLCILHPERPDSAHWNCLTNSCTRGDGLLLPVSTRMMRR